MFNYFVALFLENVPVKEVWKWR